MLCTTADASPAAGDFMLFKQILEGYDVQRIAKGTSSASPLTLSFWVKANVTGTYIIEIADSTNNRRIAASYTINASATWEYKTVTISADTTGTLANDANAALEVVWWLGAGSTFSSGTLQTTWGTTVNANRAVGQTNLASATSNYWQVTGVQLETGSVATGFEFLPFGDELRRLQRYFQKSFAPETTPAQNISANAILYSTTPAADGQYRTPVVFMTDMRAIPSTITTFNPFAANSSWRIVGAVTDRAVTANADSSKAFHVLQSVTPGALIGHWTASAEL
jgi:hypothetical protein